MLRKTVQDGHEWRRDPLSLPEVRTSRSNSEKKGGKNLKSVADQCTKIELEIGQFSRERFDLSTRTAIPKNSKLSATLNDDISETDTSCQHKVKCI